MDKYLYYKEKVLYGDSIKFSSAESSIIEVLFCAKGATVSKSTLEKHGWGMRGTSDSSLTVAITSIRKKTKNNCFFEIVTIPREGYKVNLLRNHVSEYKIEFPLNDDQIRYGYKTRNNTFFILIKRVLCYFIIIVYISALVTNYLIYRFDEIQCFEFDNVICHLDSKALSPMNESAFFPSERLILLNEDFIYIK